MSETIKRYELLLAAGMRTRDEILREAIAQRDIEVTVHFGKDVPDLIGFWLNWSPIPSSDYEAFMRDLLDGGLKPNGLMSWAVCSGSMEIVKMMIAAGGDINEEDEDGVTPLAALIYDQNDAYAGGWLQEVIALGANVDVSVRCPYTEWGDLLDLANQLGAHHLAHAILPYVYKEELEAEPAAREEANANPS